MQSSVILSQRYMFHGYAIKTLRRTHIKHHSFLDHGTEKFKLGLQPIRFSQKMRFSYELTVTCDRNFQNNNSIWRLHDCSQDWLSRVFRYQYEVTL